MKKWKWILPVVIVMLVLPVYLLIPGSIPVAGFKIANCPTASVSRLIGKKDPASRWWPGTRQNDSLYEYGGTKYSFPASEKHHIRINAVLNDLSVSGEINTYFYAKDSAAIELKYEPFQPGISPLTRIQYFFKALTLKKQLLKILDAYRNFAEQSENIYGFPIVQSTVKDSSLISYKKEFNHFPSDQEISALNSTLLQYIEQNKGIRRGDMMLNINKTTENSYEAMVAIPLLKDIPSTKEIFIKKMILGNILELKLSGGLSTIARGESALRDYMTDYHKVSPAIPFQVLVTDRYKEPDSTKWVTILKYPIF